MFLVRANLSRMRALLLSFCVLLPLLALATLCPCLLASQTGGSTQDAPDMGSACCEHCCPPAKSSGQHQPAGRVACCGTLQATLAKADRLASGSVPQVRVPPEPNFALSMLLAAHYRQVLGATNVAAAAAPPRDPPITFVRIVSRRCFPSNAPPIAGGFLS